MIVKRCPICRAIQELLPFFQIADISNIAIFVQKISKSFSTHNSIKLHCEPNNKGDTVCLCKSQLENNTGLSKRSLFLKQNDLRIKV